MALSDKQLGQLGRAPAAAHVRTIERKGRELAYLDAWRAIEAANRIFGPDGWDRETLEMRCAASKQIGTVLTAAYVARVRITVHAEGRAIVREGQGCGEGRGDTPFEAHDMGLKAAEIDATKRALATFGRALGLGLYLGERPGAARTKAKTQDFPAAPGQARTPVGAAAVAASMEPESESALSQGHPAPDTDWAPDDDPEDNGPAGGARSSAARTNGSANGQAGMGNAAAPRATRTGRWFRGLARFHKGRTFGIARMRRTRG